MHVLVVALALAAADPMVESESASGFRCDGTNEALFEEMKRAGTLGYGETWDETTCDEGVAIYAEGATSRWKDLRQPRRTRINPEDQMLALVMPLFALGGLGAVILAAGALAAASRLKKRIVLDVACPACDANLPIPADDKTAHQLFCPVCGAACAVDVKGRGKNATGTARLLNA